jgi:hypothetical protein
MRALRSREEDWEQTQANTDDYYMFHVVDRKVFVRLVSSNSRDKANEVVKIEEVRGLLEVRDGILQENELVRDQFSILRDNLVSNHIWGYRFTLLRRNLLVHRGLVLCNFDSFSNGEAADLEERILAIFVSQALCQVDGLYVLGLIISVNEKVDVFIRSLII